MTKLHGLRLSGGDVGDGGLVHVAGLKRLIGLHLFGPGISDAGLSQLEGLKVIHVS